MGVLLTMWASPSKIPINTSLASSGNLIAALSDEDKRIIPFVERVAKNTLEYIKNKIRNKSFDIVSYIHSISTMVGLSI